MLPIDSGQADQGRSPVAWHAWLELIAEVTGFAGGALLALPYFIGARVAGWRTQFDAVRTTDPDARAALDETSRVLAHRQSLQTGRDLRMSATGFVLVALSFLTKVVIWFARNPV